jgi:type I restriction enzyme M protein
MPKGTFTGAGVTTVVLFFEKGVPTRKIWYYQLKLDRNLGKTNSLTENDLDDFVLLQKTKAESLNSWTVKLSQLDSDSFDLAVRNPNKGNEIGNRTPTHILSEIRALDSRSEKVIETIKAML